MLWAGGRVIPDDALAISPLDRTFEHGLGLFETFRTWNGRPTLLDRHLARLKQSATALGLPIAGRQLPDARAVAELLRAEGHDDGDALLRITLTGGLSATGGSTLWLRASPLSPMTRAEGAIVSLGPWEVNRHDPMTRHKALNYWQRRLAFEETRRLGFDEVLSASEGRYCEGSRTNLFVIRGDVLGTPATLEPIVPGIMRGLVLEQARALPLKIDDQACPTIATIGAADEVFLTNAVRGIIPVAQIYGPSERPGTAPLWTGEAPGPWTRRLWTRVSDWLHREGTLP
jgi:branched-subunit amino acid aminotransferase/4-amino-4-deoxychorismate lyase